MHDVRSCCVLDCLLFPKSDVYHRSFRLRCDQDSIVLTDDVQIHTIELPNFHRTAEEISQCSDKEKWLYFLVNAEYLEAAEISTLLPGPEFEEATGVLAMVSQTPDERQFYEDRLKFLRDQNAQIQQARFEGLEEGLEKGIERGTLSGKIQLLQQLLGDNELSTLDLSRYSIAELSFQLQDLQNRLRTRDV